jgi:ABC-type polysaccharide/polyol phosphate transport system ATPase subunit
VAQIRVDRLGVCFDLDRQQRPMTPAMRRVRRRHTTIWALRDVSFELAPGAGVALIGPNGAGKTTLLRALAGVLPADEGSVEVRGRIGSLLSVDGGLMPPLTGRENALLLGVLAGLSRAQARVAVDAIKRRSDLGEAFERAVSTYSQGMQARLGFAVVEQTDPEVLLLDEVHEAIDEQFRPEVEATAAAIRERGGIVIAAGHDHAELARLCDQALVLGRSGVRALDRLDWAQQAGERSIVGALP